MPPVQTRGMPPLVKSACLFTLSLGGPWQVTDRPGIAAKPALESLRCSDYLRSNGHRVSSPLLVLIGTKDRVVSAPFAKKFVDDAASADKEYATVEDAWHLLLHEPDVQKDVIGRVMMWIRVRL